MNWRTQYNLITGMVGKSIIIISLATPFSILINIGVDIFAYKITLTGALLVIVSYFLTLLNIPSLIVSFPDSSAYSNNLIEINEQEYLDFVSEFKILEDKVDVLPSGYDSFWYKNYNFESIEEAKTTLGPKISVRTMAFIKYDYINNSSKKMRFFIFTIFVFGILLFYLPLGSRLCSIFFGD